MEVERISIRPRRIEEGGEKMRRGYGIVAAIVGILLLVAVAVGAYHAGMTAEAVHGGHVVQVVGPAVGVWHPWFFPFGFLFFPLIIIGVILLVRFAVGGPRWGHGWGYGPGGGWGHGPGNHGPWSDEGRARFEDRFEQWHRHQHERTPGGETPPEVPTPPGPGPAAPSSGG
jgi:hypothetical protein